MKQLKVGKVLKEYFNTPEGRTVAGKWVPPLILVGATGAGIVYACRTWLGPWLEDRLGTWILLWHSAAADIAKLMKDLRDAAKDTQERFEQGVDELLDDSVEIAERAEDAGVLAPGTSEVVEDTYTIAEFIDEMFFKKMTGG